MKITFIEDSLPIWVNICIVIANILYISYNFPQIYKTYKRKTTKDISGLFLFLRIIGNSFVLVYTTYILNVQLIILNLVTIFSSTFVGYYKVKELYIEYKYKNIVKKNVNNCDITNVDTLITKLQDIYTSYGNTEIKLLNITLKNNKYIVINFLDSSVDVDSYVDTFVSSECSNDIPLRILDNENNEAMAKLIS